MTWLLFTICSIPSSSVSASPSSVPQSIYCNIRRTYYSALWWRANNIIQRGTDGNKHNDTVYIERTRMWIFDTNTLNEQLRPFSGYLLNKFPPSKFPINSPEIHWYVKLIQAVIRVLRFAADLTLKADVRGFSSLWIFKCHSGCCNVVALTTAVKLKEVDSQESGPTKIITLHSYRITSTVFASV